jgi:hypothetical protein
MNFDQLVVLIQQTHRTYKQIRKSLISESLLSKLLYNLRKCRMHKSEISQIQCFIGG